MALYRIMIVDDEEEIRDGIRRKIDWNGNGFDLAATAENGQEALELAEALRPDVVMTDIKMPFMDGLTLARHLTELLPGIKLVVFSGFDDFEYAQRCISLGVTEYLLKPVDAAELTLVLQRLRAQLDGEFAEKRNLELLRRHYAESLPMLREQFYTRLIDGRVSSQSILEQSAQFDIDARIRYWSAALCHIDADLSHGPIRQGELLPLSIKQLMEETLEKFVARTTLYNDSVAVIAAFEKPEQVMDLIDALNRVCLLARRFMEIGLTVGVGAPCEGLAELHRSAAGARTALDYRVVLGTGHAIYIEDVEPNTTTEFQYSEQDERELISAIKLGSPDDIRAACQRFTANFRGARMPLGQYQLYLMEILAELVKTVRTYQIDPAEVFGRDFDSGFSLSSFESLDALWDWFTETCLRISVLIRRERTNSTKAVADNACRFITERYGDPEISVEMLCGHLHISPAYFSTLFKKETGMSFVAYLTERRMEKAVDLLAATEDKTYEIAAKVGYTEPNYFSYVFKKQFGMSPTKYRASKLRGA